MFDDGLKCHVPGCKKVIRAVTGLQELQKLQAHIRKAHGANWTMNETLENRVKIEDRQGRYAPRQNPPGKCDPPWPD